MAKPRPHKLKIVRIPITSREMWLEMRKLDVTASVVGALFGVHPFQTPAGLWAEKTGTEIPDEDSKMKRRGRLFEDAVARAFLEEQPGWKLRKPDVYLRAPAIGLGATPDFFMTRADGRRAVLQCKTVNPHEWKRSWTDTVAPMWISLQTLTETMLARFELGIIACLVVDGWHFDLHVYEVPRHAGAERRIQDAVMKFWDDVKNGREPKIDYERDGALIAVMWPREQEGKVVDLRADNELPGLLDEAAALEDEIRKKSKLVDVLKNELKVKMKDAEAALIGGGWRATFKEQQRKEYTVKACSYRVLRLNKENQQEAA